MKLNVFRHCLCSLVAVGCLGLLPATGLTADATSITNGAWTTITPENPRSIQAAIDAAIAAGRHELKIPPGLYEIPGTEPAGKRNIHLRVAGAGDLTIDATGVTLIFADRYQHSLGFMDCTNVTFHGATLRRKTSSVSQGVIAAIRNNGKSIDVRIDKGYPTDIDNRTLFSTFWASVFTLDRSRWLAHYRAATPPVMERLEADLFRIAMTEDAQHIGVPLQVGQPLGWRGAEFDDLRVMNCKGMKFVDVTIQGGSGMCIHEYGGDGNLYRNCRVTYGALPPGATEKPLWASSADGFHSGEARHGPTIDGCLFEGIDDDAIAIHGTYGCVVEGADTRVVVWRTPFANDLLFGRSGDALRFYDTEGIHRADRTIVATRALKDYHPRPDYHPQKLYRFFSNPTNAAFVELTLDASLAPEPNWLVCNANEIGSGFIIRNTVIRGCGARGIMAKASDGLIEGCTIERMARAAIEFMPEHVVWPEADYARNITVRGNVIRNVSFNRQPGFLRNAGALTIYGYRSGKDYLPAGGHRNILIENNLFEENNGPNLLIASADGVTVRSNRFVRPMQVPSTFTAGKGINPQALVCLTQCTNVVVGGNVVVAPGPGMVKPVDATPSAQGSGFEAGMRVETETTP